MLQDNEEMFFFYPSVSLISRDIVLFSRVINTWLCEISIACRSAFPAFSVRTLNRSWPFSLCYVFDTNLHLYKNNLTNNVKCKAK